MNHLYIRSIFYIGITMPMHTHPTPLLPHEFSMISVPVSLGVFIDKLTILEIKAERITNPQKLVYVREEATMLNNVFHQLYDALPDTIQCQLNKFKNNLKLINEHLWNIEDAIRVYEAEQLFDDAFITLARQVYLTNDQRITIKNKISTLVGSRLIEQKSYAHIAPPPVVP